MAGKLLKSSGKRKIAAKRSAKKTEDGSVVLVGTYRERQLDWIKKNGVYNYGPKLEGKTVVARAIDFATGRGQTKKVAAAVRQFHADGEYASLADYLPTDLANVPRPQLRVCEAAVQLDFYCAMFAPLGNALPKEEKTVISMFSGAMGLDIGIEYGLEAA